MSDTAPTKAENKRVLAGLRRDAMLERFAAFAMQSLIEVHRVEGGRKVTCDTEAAWDIAEAMCAEWERRVARG